MHKHTCFDKYSSFCMCAVPLILTSSQLWLSKCSHIKSRHFCFMDPQASPSNSAGRTPLRQPSSRSSPLTSPTNCSHGGLSPRYRNGPAIATPKIQTTFPVYNFIHTDKILASAVHPSFLPSSRLFFWSSGYNAAGVFPRVFSLFAR